MKQADVRSPAESRRADTRPGGRLTRLAMFAGTGFAVFTAAAFLEIGPNPDSHAAIAQVTTFYARHHGQLYLGGILLGCAAILLAVFGTAIWETIRGTGQHAVAAGVAAVGTAIAAGGLLATATSYVTLGDIGNQPTTSAGALQAVHIAGSETSLATAAGLALVLLAVALTGITARAFPRWLAWPALVIGALQLVIPVSFTAFLLVLPWAIAMSVVMTFRAAHPAPLAAQQDLGAPLTSRAPASS